MESKLDANEFISTAGFEVMLECIVFIQRKRNPLMLSVDYLEFLLVLVFKSLANDGKSFTFQSRFYPERRIQVINEGQQYNVFVNGKLHCVFVVEKKQYDAFTELINNKETKIHFLYFYMMENLLQFIQAISTPVDVGAKKTQYKIINSDIDLTFRLLVDKVMKSETKTQFPSFAVMSQMCGLEKIDLGPEKPECYQFDANGVTTRILLMKN